MKTCTICKSQKELTEFSNNKTKPDGKNNMCKGCKKEYNRGYYSLTKDIHNPKRYSRRDKVREGLKDFIKEYKESRPCSDCGNFYPSFVMDFDHQRDKSFNIGGVVASSLQVLIAEIEKCELVCSNCHRIRTYGPQALK